MSIPLAEALEKVDLEAGKTYRCRVREKWVVLRVLESNTPDLAKPFMEEDVMLDSWVELPPPKPIKMFPAKLGQAPAFDTPEIPEEDQGP